jgi:hypothetical protein
VLKDYGLLTAHDAALISDCLTDVARRFPSGNLNILEIGVHDGKTARSIAAWMEGLERPFQYFGIENGKDLGLQRPPFVGASVTHGDSVEVYRAIPSQLHFVFVDGCHCINHVALDFLHYGRKVVVGGLLLFHDTGVGAQGRDYQHGPDHPDHYIAVRAALDLVGLPGDKRWRLVKEVDAANWGGVRAYERV